MLFWGCVKGGGKVEMLAGLAAAMAFYGIRKSECTAQLGSAVSLAASYTHLFTWAPV